MAIAKRSWKPSPQQMARMRVAVFGRDDWTCRLCGKHMPAKSDAEITGRLAPYDGTDFLELDHITPWAAGGMFIPENMQAACSTCNRIKSASTATADYGARIARAIQILQSRPATEGTAIAAIEALTGASISLLSAS